MVTVTLAAMGVTAFAAGVWVGIRAERKRANTVRIWR